MLASELGVWLSAGLSNSHVGPEGVPVFNLVNLARASSTLAGRTVDGITCRAEAKEIVKYHVHVVVFINGKMPRLPVGIGTTKPQLVQRSAAGVFVGVGIYDCLYWLHPPAADGIIHVEAPRNRTPHSASSSTSGANRSGRTKLVSPEEGLSYLKTATILWAALGQLRYSHTPIFNSMSVGRSGRSNRSPTR